MTPYFRSAERMRQLTAAIDLWEGTPFHPHGRTPGEHGGCSCETLVAGVYVESGFLPPDYVFPRASLRTGYATMLEHLQGPAARIFQPMDPPAQPGDLVVFHQGRRGHMAVVVSGVHFMHCLHHTGTTYGRLDDATWLNMPHQFWRPVEE